MGPFRQGKRDKQSLWVMSRPTGDVVYRRDEEEGEQIVPEKDELRGSDAVVAGEELMEGGVDV